MIKEIKRKIIELKDLDTNFKVFGSKSHNYTFNPKVKVNEIVQFEKSNNLLLPKDYREFLLEIGNGGMGPYYGIQEIDLDNPRDFRLEENSVIDLSKVFPYQKKWNADWINELDWDEDRPSESVHNEYWSTSHLSGAYPICHYGHGDSFLIIINGLQKGNIWFDGRGNYSGIEPELNEGEPITFYEWYLKWLDNEIELFKK